MAEYRGNSKNSTGFTDVQANRLYKLARGRHRRRYWDDIDKDQYTCPLCGETTPQVEQWELHHIDHNPLNGHPMNLVGLCSKCHYRVHGRTPPETLDDWKTAFLSLGDA